MVFPGMVMFFIIQNWDFSWGIARENYEFLFFEGIVIT